MPDDTRGADNLAAQLPLVRAELLGPTAHLEGSRDLQRLW